MSLLDSLIVHPLKHHLKRSFALVFLNFHKILELMGKFDPLFDLF